MLKVYDAAGWAVAILTLALFTVLPVWQVLHYQEPVRAAGPRPGWGAIVSVFRVPGVARWALVVLTGLAARLFVDRSEVPVAMPA